MSLRLLGGLLTLDVERRLCDSGYGPGGFAVSAETFRQHRRRGPCRNQFTVRSRR